MNPTRAPLILVGQIYLSAELNEYLIVTNNNRGQISYQGVGFKGQAEDATFVDQFDPVDPDDIDDPLDLKELLEFCPKGTVASVGYVPE